MSETFFCFLIDQTHIHDVILKASNHCIAGFYSVSEDKIIPLSGVSKSGAGCIIHAGGDGGATLWACGVDTQPALAIANTLLKIIKPSFRIS